MRTNFLPTFHREAEGFGGVPSNWYKEYQDALSRLKKKDEEIAKLTIKLNRLQGVSTYGNYLYNITNCPGYEGHTPQGKTYEVCKHCGSISYYH